MGQKYVIFMYNLRIRFLQLGIDLINKNTSSLISGFYKNAEVELQNIVVSERFIVQKEDASFVPGVRTKI